MAASGWQRTTTQGTLASAPAVLQRAVRARADSDGLDLPDQVTAFRTESGQQGGGLFRRAGKQVTTLLVLGPRDVVVVVDQQDGDEPAVLTARWEAVRLTELGSRLPTGAVSGKLAETLQQAADDGIDLTGFAVTSEGGPGTYHVGLGLPDGPAARDAVRSAIQQARAR